MVVVRSRKVQQLLQDDMQVGGLEEVDSSNDIGNALEPVVVDHGEVVAGPNVFAYDDGVTE